MKNSSNNTASILILLHQPLEITPEQQIIEDEKIKKVLEFMYSPYPITVRTQDGSEYDMSSYIMRLIEAAGTINQTTSQNATLYLREGRNEARAVGQEISDIYGFEMMQTIHSIMTNHFLPIYGGNELEAAWNRIGKWRW